MVKRINKRMVCTILALTLAIANLPATAKAQGTNSLTKPSEITEVDGNQKNEQVTTPEENSTTEQAQTVNPFTLPESLQLEMKSFVKEKIVDGYKIGTVVKVKNISSKPVRIPNYEVQIVMADGTIHTMKPSSDNVKSLQPGSVKEHSYLSLIETSEELQPIELRWVEIDRKVYPKTETLAYAMNIPAENLETTSTESVMQWGQEFAIPGFDEAIKIMPVSITKEFSNISDKRSIRTNKPLNNVYILTVQVTNTSESKKKIPNYTINGLSGKDIYEGTRIEQEQVQAQTLLAPSEKKLMKFAIHTEDSTILQTLKLHTLEPFVQLDPVGQEQTTELSVARAQISLPNKGHTDKPAIHYQWGDTMHLEKTLSRLIPPNVSVSVADYSIFKEGDDAGYKTVLLKFKLRNSNKHTVQLPLLQTELVSPYGDHFAGTQQETAIKEIMPNTSALVAYTFLIPPSETRTDFMLRVIDDQVAAPYKTRIGAFWVQLQDKKTSNQKFNLYPYEIEVREFKSNYITQLNPDTESKINTGLHVKFDFKIKRNLDVLVDQNLIGLQFDLTDNRNRRLAPSQHFTLLGENKLVDGIQDLVFTDINLSETSYPLFVNVYETLNTPNGTVKRLLGKFARQ